MATGGRAIGVVTVLLGACCCGGVWGFVSPVTRGGSMTAIQRRTSPGLPAALAKSRPRALPLLYSSKEPKSSGGGIVDAFTVPDRELSTEEKLLELQREIQSQAAIADETEANMTPEEVAAMEKEDTKDLDEEEVESMGFMTTPDFVDEGNNIIWPDTRRVVQLTVLAVIAQIAFVVYILGLNAILNSIPIWWEKLIEAYKAGNSLV